MSTKHIIGGVAMIVHDGDIYCRLRDMIDQADSDKQIRETFQEEEQPTAPPPPPRQSPSRHVAVQNQRARSAAASVESPGTRREPVAVITSQTATSRSSQRPSSRSSRKASTQGTALRKSA